MTKGFIDSQRGLDVNEFDEETMFIEPGQLQDPLGSGLIFFVLFLYEKKYRGVIGIQGLSIAEDV